MANNECPHIAGCEMYSLLKLSGTLKAWQARYCCADFSQCARYKLSLEGHVLPCEVAQLLFPERASHSLDALVRGLPRRD